MVHYRTENLTHFSSLSSFMLFDRTWNYLNYLKKFKWAFPGLFSLFSSFLQTVNRKLCRWLDLNLRPLVWEATTLPQLPFLWSIPGIIFFHLCSIQSLVLALSFPKFEGTTLTKDKFTLLQKFCFHKGIEQSPTLEGEVLLYGWPPVWLVWIQPKE